MAIQAIIASIHAPELHEAILRHENKALALQSNGAPGLFLMVLLGIEEWFTTFNAAQTLNTTTGIEQLRYYISRLPLIKTVNQDEFDAANITTRKILIALIIAESHIELDPAYTPSLSSVDSTQSLVTTEQSAAS
jgi:hypothetical protein